jgi:hypothetical protein
MYTQIGIFGLKRNHLATLSHKILAFNYSPEFSRFGEFSCDSVPRWMELFPQILSDILAEKIFLLMGFCGRCATAAAATMTCTFFFAGTFSQLMNMVARFFMAQCTQTGKNIPNDHKICIPNGNKIYQITVK